MICVNMSAVLKFSGLITFLAGVHGLSTTCPSGWLANDGSCYLFGHYPRPFNEAKAYCQQHGGELVEVRNSGVNEFIKDHLRMLNRQHWWIGLIDSVIPGTWTWAADGDLTNYTDWYPGQPTNRNEDCSYFAYNYDFKWADGVCTTSMAPICELRGVTCFPTTDIVG